MIDVSVCIVNRNGADLLRACLGSLADPPPQAVMEIIVVDNASTDGSRAMLGSLFPEVRLIANNENLGFAAANNQAFELACGRYLLLLNNDTVMLPGAVDALVRFIESRPNAGIVGPRLLNSDGSLQPSCRAFPTVWSMAFRAAYLDKLFPAHRWFGAGALQGWTHDRPREVDALKGCCMLVRREVLDGVGPLDPGFLFYFEEVDWCFRARQGGWQTWFTPEAQVIHHGGRVTSQETSGLSAVYYASLLRFFRKHRGRAAAASVRLLAVAETATRLVYWSTRSLAAASGSHARRKAALNHAALSWLITGQSPDAGLRLPQGRIERA